MEEVLNRRPYFLLGSGCSSFQSDMPLLVIAMSLVHGYAEKKRDNVMGKRESALRQETGENCKSTSCLGNHHNVHNPSIFGGPSRHPSELQKISEMEGFEHCQKNVGSQSCDCPLACQSRSRLAKRYHLGNYNTLHQDQLSQGACLKIKVSLSAGKGLCLS